MLSLSRFDRLIVVVVVSLALLTAGLIWRGDHVGVRVASLFPEADARNVSTQATVRVTFDQEIVNQSAAALSFSPALSGTLRWEGSTLLFEPARPLQPETGYTVTLAAGLEAHGGRQLLEAVQWRFATGQPRVLFLGWTEPGQNQLLVVDAAGESAVPLSAVTVNILDYAVSPDGTQVAYSALREDGGSDLWAVPAAGGEPRPLLACGDAACLGPAWAPVGLRLVYERRNLPGPGGAPGAPRLWWLDLGTAQTTPVFEDSQWLGRAASFSTAGQWLSYVAPLAQEVQVWNIGDGRTLEVGSFTGERAVWSPAGDVFLVSDVFFADAGHAIHLLRVDAVSGEVRNLTGDGELVTDGFAAWSPDGHWIAFERKPVGVSMGKQIWLMRADGAEARPVTDEPEINFGFPAWSPDGRYLAFQRYDLAQAWANPAIWRYELATGEMKMLAPAGFQPTWLP